MTDKINNNQGSGISTPVDGPQTPAAEGSAIVTQPAPPPGPQDSRELGRVIQGVQAGQAAPFNPYRYMPGHPRRPDEPLTQTAALAAVTRWQKELNPETLGRVTKETSALPAEKRLAKEHARLDLQGGHSFFTASHFNVYTRLFRMIREALAENFPGLSSYKAASFGAGLVNPETIRDEATWADILVSIAKQKNWPMPVISPETFELRAIFGEVDVFDRSEAVLEASHLPNGYFLQPLQDPLGNPLNRHDLEAVLGPISESIDPDSIRVVTLDGHTFGYLRVNRPMGFTEGIHRHRIDLATQQFPRSVQNKRFHVASWLQSHYYFHPVLAKAHFIKIINQLEVNGYLLTDYMLTAAEAAALGLSVIYRNQMSHAQPAQDGRDGGIAIYLKAIHSPVIVDLMRSIRKTQEAAPEYDKHKTQPPSPPKATTAVSAAPQKPGIITPANRWALDWLTAADMSAVLAESQTRPFMKPHFDASRAHILEAARIALERARAEGRRPTALILGSGHANDIPLAELDRDFNVTLADLDEAGLIKSKRGLSHTDSLLWDLTEGFALKVAEFGRGLLDSSTDINVGFKRFMEAFAQIPVTAPDFKVDAKPDLVVSSMLISQLIAYPMRGVRDALERKLGEPISDPEMAALFGSPIQGRLMQAHLEGLQNAVEKYGSVVYLSSDIISYTQLPGQPQRHTPLLFDTQGSPLKELKVRPRPQVRIMKRHQWKWSFSNMSDRVPPELMPRVRQMGIDLNQDIAWRPVEALTMGPLSLAAVGR